MRIISRVGIGKNPTSHHLDISGSVNIDSHVFIQGNAFLNANIDLGNTFTDLIAVYGQSTTSVIPLNNENLNVGSSALFWQNFYSKNLIIKNSGSVESDGGIINIGTVSSSIINVGAANTIISIPSSSNKTQSQSLTISDKIFTLNKGGFIESGFDSGIEIKENSFITGYLKTSTSRNRWSFKAPNVSGTISLLASNSSADLTIVSSSSVDRIWTVPDVSETFAGENTSQNLSNKTVNNTTVVGDFTITGRAIGVGFLPIGSIIPIASNIAGTYNCTNITSADSFGFVRCGFNGQTGTQVISDPTSPLNGETIPRINNDIFLMGNITSSNLINSSNSRTLSISNLPPHSHTLDHDHPAKTSSSTQPDINHSHSVAINGTDTNHYHGFTEQGLDESDNSWRGGGTPSGSYMVYARNRSRTTALVTGQTFLLTPPPVDGYDFLYSINLFGTNYYYYQRQFRHNHNAGLNSYSAPAFPSSSIARHTHTFAPDISSVSTGNGPGTGTSFDIRPSYIQTVYVMRIK